MYKTVNWKTGPARARYNLELKNKKKIRPQATSSKRQATSNKRQAASLKKLDPTINWDKFLKELTN